MYHKLKNTDMTYIDNDIDTVEKIYHKRGGEIKVYWKNHTFTSSIKFDTRKETNSYYDWITCNPKHPSHQTFNALDVDGDLPF